MSDNTLLARNRVLSRAGHAAVSMKGTDDEWISIQTNTFMNWVNEQLKDSGIKVNELTDFCDGVILCTLVETLQHKSIGKVIREPSNHHQMLHNASLALKAIANDKVKLVNIGSEDIINGNGKLILGLIWQLILRYQIGKTKFPPKKLMIAWLQAVIPECNISNFTRDWNSGVALHALLDYCKPGLSPDWRNLDPSNGLKNCQSGMELAKKHFDIPLVLRPEDLSSSELDELSGMTYLSYYMKLDSPGYHATLKWVKGTCQQDVKNFTTDWNDGKTLGKLVTSLGGKLPPLTGTNVENLQTAIAGGNTLGVEPILTAKEMADIEVEHLGIMAYAARFGHLKPTAPASDRVDLLGNFDNVHVGSESQFSLKISDDDLNKKDLVVTIAGPVSTVPNYLTWSGNQVKGRFTPTHPGLHEIKVFWKGQLISDCPVKFNTVVDVSKIQTTHPERMVISKPEEIKMDTSKVGSENMTCEAISPSGNKYDLPVSDQSNGQSIAKFLPQEPGTWKVCTYYNNKPLPGNPVTVDVFDPSAVRVYGLDGGSIGNPFVFTADCSKAGPADIKVDVTHNENHVRSTIKDEGNGIHKVSFTPQKAGEYTVNVTYGDHPVKGSPFKLDIVDSGMVNIDWKGDRLVPINTAQSFTIDTAQAGTGDVKVTVTGPDGVDITPRLKESPDGVQVEWVPNKIGDYFISVDFAGHPVTRVPYQVKVYDPSSVSVGPIKDGKLKKPVSFELDVGNAGMGNLAITVAVNGNNIPNDVRKLDAKHFEVSFLPTVAAPHFVTIKFNGDHVPGSPFQCKISDSSQVLVKGQGIESVPVGHIASFTVDPQSQDVKDCTAQVVSDSGKNVPVRIKPVGDGYRVEYTPKEVGPHHVTIWYDDMEVPGAPFTCQVYDPDNVRVTNKPKAYINKPVTLQVDASGAGVGVVDGIVKCHGKVVPSSVRNLSGDKYEVTFTPTEQAPHSATITFNGDVVCGGPLNIDVQDRDLITATGPGLELCEVLRPTYFDVNTRGQLDGDLDIKILSQSGECLTHHISPGNHTHRVEFTPRLLGAHRVDVLYDGLPIHGSPFKMETYDPGLITIRGVKKTGRNDHEVGFIVDAKDAGPAKLDVEVTHNGQQVSVDCQNLGDGVYQYMFTPKKPGVYDANITFNNITIPDAPIHIEIQEQIQPSMFQINSKKVVPFDRHGRNWFVIEIGGRNIAPDVLAVNIKDPAGREVSCDISQQSDGDYKVQWFPTIPGRYTIRVLFAGKPIHGSPFYVDVLDVSQVNVDHVKGAAVGQPASFNVNFDGAGESDYDLRIIGPSGMTSIPYSTEDGADGMKVMFMPTEPGIYQVYLRYGGLDVPGCPIMIEVEDSRMPLIQGEGLIRGVEDKIASFFVDARDLRGDLAVQVEGPNSIAKCTIEEQAPGVFVASYIPTEVGVYNIIVKWNNKEIPGSPFHPKIIDPNKVYVRDGWQHHMDNKNRLNLTTDEVKRIPFDISHAGPGVLTARVIGPSGTLIPVHMDTSDNVATLMFTPRQEGTHEVHIFWSDNSLPQSPLIGLAKSRERHSSENNKVVLSGRGLREAIVHENAVFVIDGTEAEPGVPNVKLEGLKHTLSTNLQMISKGKYRCDYTPDIAGAYLLHITWNGRTLKGSPFKVNVLLTPQLQPIHISGEGLKGGMMGKELNVIIDTSRASPGDLTAHCMGPNLVAPCQLTDLMDGTYKLSIHPQETGQHTLNIKYAGEHVYGSPYILTIYDQPDAGKVIVSGPGIRNGILPEFESHFIVETKGAGGGDLTVRIRGPKGAFQVEMIRENRKDRTITCKYAPSENGLYIIHVHWSGVAVPGSPFFVNIVDSKLELERLEEELRYNGSSNYSGY